MSTKKLIPVTPILLSAIALPLFAQADNLLQSAAFSNYEPGSQIGEPWKTRSRGEQTAIQAQAPDEGSSTNWAYIKDADAKEKVYLITNVAPVSKGTLSFTVYFPISSATVGIYLRSDALPKDENNIVEFKALEGSGNIYVGSNGNRQKLPVKVAGSEYMSFDIEFDATDAGEKIDVYIKDDNGRHLIHSMSAPLAHAIDTVMITTDTNTAMSEFYVGDLALKEG